MSEHLLLQLWRPCTGSKIANKHCTWKQLQGELNKTRKTSRRWRVAGLMIDTFIHDSDALIIITTGVALPHLIWSQALFCEPCQTFSLPAFFLPFISVVKSAWKKKMWPRTLPTEPRKAGCKCLRQEAH